MFETRNFSNKNNRGRRQVCVHLERICNVFNRRSRYLHSEIGFSKAVSGVVSQFNGGQKFWLEGC